MYQPPRHGPRRRGFGMALLAAMHDWRERQAAREIQYYRHLIHDPRARTGWLSIGRSESNASQPQPHRICRDSPTPKPRSGSGRMSLEMKLIIAALAAFAVLHVAVGVMLMQHATHAPGETAAVMHHGD